MEIRKLREAAARQRARIGELTESITEAKAILCRINQREARLKQIAEVDATIADAKQDIARLDVLIDKAKQLPA